MSENPHDRWHYSVRARRSVALLHSLGQDVLTACKMLFGDAFQDHSAAGKLKSEVALTTPRGGQVPRYDVRNTVEVLYQNPVDGRSH